ncbi:hypothetical protein [Pasteurella bettyae]|nr:hypothetical protein [Pasteurella bettyae]
MQKQMASIPRLMVVVAKALAQNATAIGGQTNVSGLGSTAVGCA